MIVCWSMACWARVGSPAAGRAAGAPRSRRSSYVKSGAERSFSAC